MIIFKDLVFKSRFRGGIGATHTFENGLEISVQGSKMNYCTPREDLEFDADYSSFEVAVFGKDGDFITKNYIKNHDQDVMGWMDRADISILMIKIQFDK